jgi:signal transduction histidine kinase
MVSLAAGVAAGRGSDAPTAAATLAVALAFNPSRRGLQAAVDRRFARVRYEALRQVSAFLAELRAGRAEPETVGAVLGDALGDDSLELRYWLDETAEYVDARGAQAAVDPLDARARTMIERAGTPVAVVLHDPRFDEQPYLLTGVFEAAGLAIEVARLQVELRQRIEEIEASRGRIVSATYEERRRIERDLHDGVQPRLVSAGLRLREIQRGMPSNADDRALDGAVAEIRQAIDDLRELARGVRPSQLDHGLAPALQELAQRTALPVTVRATPERFSREIESAAYFIASEGLTNAVKHSGAANVALAVTRIDENVVVSVSDNGVGGAVAGPGSGLAGLADRVEAHGGTFRLQSSPATGTRLTVELPAARLPQHQH